MRLNLEDAGRGRKEEGVESKHCAEHYLTAAARSTEQVSTHVISQKKSNTGMVSLVLQIKFRVAWDFAEIYTALKKQR